MREARTLGRPREFDEAEALRRIMEVFWAKGYEGASLSDLVAATGVKKGSLYAALGDKRGMYLKALSLYDREWISRLVRGLEGQGAPIDRIESFLESAIEGTGGRVVARGCFLCNAAVDPAAGDPEARAAVGESLARLQAALAEVLAALPARAPEAEAGHLLSVYLGLRVLAKAGADPATLAATKARALQSLRGP